MRQTLRQIIASGKGRIRALDMIVASIPGLVDKQLAKDGDLTAIGQMLIGEGYTADEIASSMRAVEDAAKYGSKTFDPDDPNNAAQMRKMVELVHAPGTLFFLTVMSASTVDALAQPLGTRPFVNGEATTFDGKQIGGVDDMVAYAKSESRIGHNVYLTVNSFLKPFYIENGKVKKYRRGENLAGSQVLIADVDIGKEGGYQTRAEAKAAITKLCVESELPEPSIIVNSGRGVHVWWVLDRWLPVEELRPLVDRFKALLMQHGLRFDQQCTANPTAVLRLAGTCNFKQGGRLAVSIEEVADPVACSVEDVEQATASVTVQPKNYAKPQTARTIGGEPDDDTLKVDIEMVAQECPTIDAMLNRGGKGDPEPLWNLAMMLASFTTDPDNVALWLSELDPRYTEAKTDKKLAEKFTARASNPAIGWPSCASFTAFAPAHCTECLTCPHRYEGKSPLNFGWEAMGWAANAIAKKCEAEWLARDAEAKAHHHARLAANDTAAASGEAGAAQGQQADWLKAAAAT